MLGTLFFLRVTEQCVAKELFLDDQQPSSKAEDGDSLLETAETLTSVIRNNGREHYIGCCTLVEEEDVLKALGG